MTPMLLAYKKWKVTADPSLRKVIQTVAARLLQAIEAHQSTAAATWTMENMLMSLVVRKDPDARNVRTMAALAAIQELRLQHASPLDSALIEKALLPIELRLQSQLQMNMAAYQQQMQNQTRMFEMLSQLVRSNEAMTRQIVRNIRG